MPDARPPRRFGSLPLEAMTPEQRVVVDAIMAGPRGMASTGLRGPFEPLLEHPALCDAAQRMGEEIRFHSSIPAALNEMAILVVAVRWKAQYEWHAHCRLALAAGLDPSVADAIAAGRRPALDADGAAVYDFVSSLLDGGTVTDGLWDAVVSRWGRRGAIDLIGLAGFYCLVSFVLNVDRYPLPDGLPVPLP
jgi:4-carboxymuconolactone decarboxylase